MPAASWLRPPVTAWGRVAVSTIMLPAEWPARTLAGFLSVLSGLSVLPFGMAMLDDRRLYVGACGVVADASTTGMRSIMD